MTKNVETHIKALYESVGRGFESLPSHQENREYIVLSVFLVRVVIQNFSKTIVVQFVFEVIG